MTKMTPTKTQPTFAIIGSGAVGGYYGALLQRAGFEVHFLFHSAYQHVAANGLIIKEKNQQFDLPEIHAYANVQDMPACDVIIIALKTTQNSHLKKLLPPLLKENSIIVTMQNGLGNEEYIAEITNKHSIVCAITTIGAVKKGPGEIQISHDGVVKVALYNELQQTNSTLELIADNFTKATISFEFHHDYLFIRWLKLLWNIPFNGLCLTQHSTADQIAKNCIPLLHALAAEIIAIAAAYNRIISMELFDKMLTVTQGLKGYKTSMVNDFELKNPLEIEYMYENPLAAAKAKNIVCPLLTKLSQDLYHLDLNNRCEKNLNSA